MGRVLAPASWPKRRYKQKTPVTRRAMLNILRILVLDMMLTLTVWLMMVKQVLRGTTTKTMMTTFTPVLDTILKTFCTKNISKAKVFALKKVNYYFNLLHLTFWLCSTYVHHWKNIEIICSNTARNFELVSEPSNYLNFNQARVGFVLTLCSLLISLNFLIFCNIVSNMTFMEIMERL